MYYILYFNLLVCVLFNKNKMNRYFVKPIQPKIIPEIYTIIGKNLYEQDLYCQEENGYIIVYSSGNCLMK